MKNHNAPVNLSKHREKEYYEIEQDIQHGHYGRLRDKYLQILDSVNSKPESARLASADVLSYAVMRERNILGKGKDVAFLRWKDSGRESKKAANSAEAKKWPFAQYEALKLLNYLWDCTYWSLRERARRRAGSDGAPDYFSALVDRMQCDRSTEENLSHTAPGLYQLWRPSIVLPGSYVFGLFAIYIDKDDGGGKAIKTIEIHRMVPNVNTDPHKAIREPNIEEVYLGYMVKKARQIIVHAFDSVTRAFQLTAINNTLRTSMEDRSFEVMSGITTGLIGQQNFFSLPLVLIRQCGIGELLRANTENLQSALAQQFPELTATDLQVLSALRAGALYSELGLLTTIPDFISVQLEAAKPRAYQAFSIEAPA